MDSLGKGADRPRRGEGSPAHRALRHLHGGCHRANDRRRSPAPGGQGIIEDCGSTSVEEERTEKLCCAFSLTGASLRTPDSVLRERFR
jgi:hypothetical protein